MITLASTSKARLALIRAAGIDADCVAPGVDEAMVKPSLLADGLGPRDVADALAELKAVRVSRRRPGLVIGADQTLDLDGALIDKAEDLDALRETLIRLRGRTHQLHSALVVADAAQPIWRIVKSARMTVRPFTDLWLDGYLERNGPAVMSAVGGYHLEGEGVQLFDRIEGDYFTVLGLPLVELIDFLRQRGELDA